MNIWLFNHYAISPEMPGGTRHYDFAKELVKRGHQVTLFASSFHYTLHKETKVYTDKEYLIEEIDGVRFVWVKTAPYESNNWRRILNMLSYSRAVSRVIKEIEGEDPEIIIGSSVHMFAVYSAYRIAKKKNVPFVMEVRDLWPQTLIDMGVSRYHPFIMLLSVMEKFLYKKAEQIIALLPKAHEYIESLNVPAEKIKWIPNGVNMERFADIPEKDWERPNDKFTVLYAGAVGQANKLDVILSTAEIIQQEHPDIQFDIVGDGPEKERLVHKKQQMGVDNVTFYPPVSKAEIYKEMRKADALVFNLENTPVFRFGISSNKLFDYMGSGVPVLFSCEAGNNPVKEASAGFTVKVDNPMDLAQNIIKLKGTASSDRKQMGQNGVAYVQKNHAISVLVDRFEQILADVRD